MPSLKFCGTYICDRSKLTETEIAWIKTHKDEKYKNISNYQETFQEEEEAYSNIRNYKIKQPSNDKSCADDNSEEPKNIDISQIICSGLTCLTKWDIVGALVHFTEALAICDVSEKFNVLIKRSDCFERLQEYEKALADCLQAIAHEGKDLVTVPYHRCVRHYINLGELINAENFIAQYTAIFKDTQAFSYKNEIQKLRNFADDINENSYDIEKCIEIIAKALKIAPHSKEFLVLKIKYLVLNKCYDEAKVVNKIIDKLCGRMLILSDTFKEYFEGDPEKCNFASIFTTLRLKIIEDYKDKVNEIKANFELAKTFIAKQKYDEAVSILHELLDSDFFSETFRRKIYNMLYTCYSNMRNQNDNLIKYASLIIEKEPMHLKVLMTRGKAYVGIKSYQNAMKDFKKILEMNIPEESREQVSNLLRDVQKICDMENKMQKIQREKERAKREALEKAKKQEEKLRQEAAKQKSNITQAEAFNDKGNVQYKSAQFQNALLVYTDAINLCPKVEKYYLNRSACYMALKDYEKALRDAIKSIDINPSCLKGYTRAINCFMITGNISQSKIYIEKMQNNIPIIESVEFNEKPKVRKLEDHHKNIVKFMFEKNYAECLKHLEKALEIATECMQYKSWKAESLVMIGKYNEALPLITNYPKEPHMMYLKGLNAFLNEDFNQSIKFFKDTLRLDPEFNEAIKHKGIVASIQKLREDIEQCETWGDMHRAIIYSTSLINIDHDNEKIKLKAYYSRGRFYFELLKYEEAMNDCNLALRIKIPNPSDNYRIQALLFRAKIHIEKEEYDFALIDIDEVLRLTDSTDFRKEASEIKVLAKFGKDNQTIASSYDILQIPRNSPIDVIKKAFKELSMKFHPDKHPDATSIEKRKYDVKFQEINTAYERLK